VSKTQSIPSVQGGLDGLRKGRKNKDCCMIKHSCERVERREKMMKGPKK